MKQSIHHRFILFFLCLTAGLLSLFLLPLADTWFKSEKLLFSQEATIAADEVLLFDQVDSPAPPEYFICNIDDDPGGVFEQGSYTPLDLAVTISNLKRLGIKHLFLGTHLHWPNADQKDNDTINTAISELESCIISVPLKRSLSDSPIPDYLAKSSISQNNITGNTNLIPEVNQTSLAPTFDIPYNTLVGFSQLESEESSHKIPLLARWNDRIILSSLLLERLKHLDLNPSDLKITLGSKIDLIGASNYIPIDEKGYFSPDSQASSPTPDIISADITELSPSDVKSHLALVTASKEDAYSILAIKEPIKQLTQLVATTHTANQRTIQRIPLWLEITLLVLLAALLARISKLSEVKFSLAALILLADVIVISLLMNHYASYWIPASHFAILIIIGWICRLFLIKPAATPVEKSPTSLEDDLVPFPASTPSSTLPEKTPGKKRLSSKKAEIKQSFKDRKNKRNKLKKKR